MFISLPWLFYEANLLPSHYKLSKNRENVVKKADKVPEFHIQEGNQIDCWEIVERVGREPAV